LALALLLICGLAEAAQAQKAAEEKKQSKHRGKITREYDQAADETRLVLGMMPVTCVKDGCIFINFRSSFTGKKPAAPLNRFIFGLYILTKTLEPFTDQTLSIRVDGEALEVGTMTFAGKIIKDELIALPYGIPLSGKELARIAAARRVEMRIGSLQFELEGEHINAISDFHRQALAQ
jgi:hypothetical protein